MLYRAHSQISNNLDGIKYVNKTRQLQIERIINVSQIANLHQ